jgi:hypothetical protein
MLTYQDFEKVNERDRAEFVARLIREHEASAVVRMAREADEYDAQRNTFIRNFVQRIFSESGATLENVVASNNKRASNLFRRLNVQRCTYSLGNGVTFEDKKTKEKMGKGFDTKLKAAAYKALIHGVSFVFWNLDHIHVFPVTEFAPLYDEMTGVLRAGVRYWRIAADKPGTAVLYEESGYTTYVAEKDNEYVETEPLKAYKQNLKKAPVDATATVVGEENYGSLPIIPFWGSDLKQSTLVGLKDGIDNYDLISNGWCNDLSDCAQVYWIVENYGGMSAADKANFRARLLYHHIAGADTQDGGKITPYAQEVPFAARESYLNMLRKDIYSDFGALDVSSISASAKTATEINAAYQPLDENADDFEFQIIECISQILALIGVEDEPQFKRNRISNQLEQVQMLDVEAGMVALDDETLLNKFPNFTPEEVQAVLDRMVEAQASRVNNTPPQPPAAPQNAGEPQDGEVNA